MILLLFILLFTWIIFEIVLIFHCGLPLKDGDLLEMLDVYDLDYVKYDCNWNDEFYIDCNHYKGPRIYKSKYSFLFTYHIKDAGVIPVWYKSTKRIEKLFIELKNKSKYNNQKRKKLGLDD